MHLALCPIEKSRVFHRMSLTYVKSFFSLHELLLATDWRPFRVRHIRNLLSHCSASMSNIRTQCIICIEIEQKRAAEVANDEDWWFPVPTGFGRSNMWQYLQCRLTSLSFNLLLNFWEDSMTFHKSRGTGVWVWVWASEAIFRARTYNRITYSVRWWWLLDEWN